MRGYATMIKVLFICHGNICRSPMAEFVMKDLVKKLVCQISLRLRLRQPAGKKLEILFIVEPKIN